MDREQEAARLGLELLGGGRLEEADAIVSEALRRSPEDGRLWQVRGRVRHRLGDRAGACADLETASLLAPLEPEARCTLAQCYAQMGLTDLAVLVYVGLSCDRRCPIHLLPTVAAGLGSLGANQEALGVCRTLIERDPSEHAGHFGVAFYRRRLGVPPLGVLEDVERAHELAPQVPLYRVALASLLDLAGRRDEAVELILGLDPRSLGCGCCSRRMAAILRDAGRPGDDERSSGRGR